MMKLDVKGRLALGLTGLVTSVLLTAVLLGLVPDRDSAIREGRAALAEIIAAESTVLLSATDIRRLEAELELAVDRNRDLVSAGLRRRDGELVVEVGLHGSRWNSLPGEVSTSSQVRVPLWSGADHWGHVELRFTAPSASALGTVVANPLVRLVGFVAVVCVLVFYVYLGKVLKQLDPSQAVPGRVRKALDTMAEGLLVLDAKGNIVLANEAFARTIGASAESLVGRRAADLPWAADGEDPAAFPWARALAEGEMQRNARLRLDLGEAGYRSFMVSCSPVVGGNEKVGGVLVSLDDVTTLEEQEQALRRSRDEAEAANRAKSEFLANMSHEIRTPMNAILGFTEVLRRGWGTDREDGRKHLEVIHSSGTHLLSLINDILDLSKVESGHLEVEHKRFCPHVTIQETILALKVKADEKGIDLEFAADGEVPESISSDPARLRQIVTNLVGNALKFTERGGVTVTERFVPAARAVEIEVRDTGVGMAPDRLEHIFDPFVQADTSITRRFGGTGLGLSISRRFARALGGDISVTSEPGKGSAFTVLIPTGSLEGIRLLGPEELAVELASLEPRSDERWEFPAARILVVDDGIENRDLTRVVLQEVGLRVEEAENGRIGVDKALAEPYDVILMDVQMPEMDGFAATRALRDAGLETPIIALTANAMQGFEEQCLAAGYTAFMTKPIDIDGLIRTLAGYVGGQRASAPAPAASAPAAPPARPASSTAPPDPAPAGQAGATAEPIVCTLVSDRPALRVFAEQFIERLDERLGAMELAVASGDLEELAQLAHWLKGTGGTVGFDVFTEPAADLELRAKASEPGAARRILAELRGMQGRLTLDSPGPQAALKNEAGAADTPDGDAGRPRFTGPPLGSTLASVPTLRPVIARFATGLDAEVGRLERARASDDLQALEVRAGRLKGKAKMAGYEPVSTAAEALEKAALAGRLEDVDDALRELRALASRVVTPDAGAPPAPLAVNS